MTRVLESARSAGKKRRGHGGIEAAPNKRMQRRPRSEFLIVVLLLHRGPADARRWAASPGNLGTLKLFSCDLLAPAHLRTCFPFSLTASPSSPPSLSFIACPTPTPCIASF